MSLTLGSRVGSYEIVSALGAGGMGEVYRARDTKLGRDVAIKSLPIAFLHDQERVARFQREAQLLASLNHPHIGAIYGLENADGVNFLVLELVEGETLADQIARGPLHLDDALAIARQVADALEAAHEKGIIHRDLKPGNIALTRDGNVKVLDFGLAKALDPAEVSSQVSMSPTLSLAATQAGVVLGTAAYMSPEQARGRGSDKRTDVWAFGCVLFEMLSGKKAFEGEDVTDIIAAVVRAEPDWNALPATVPDQIKLLIKRCLEKDRRARVSDIGVARFLMTETAALQGSGANSIVTTSTPGGAAPSRRRTLLIGATGLLVGVALAAAGVWIASRFSTHEAPLVVRFPLATTGQPVASPGSDRDIAFSPDGRFIVYLAGQASQLQIMLRDLSTFDAKELVRGAGMRYPFVSADSRWVGYFAPDGLKKVSIEGGSPITICPVGTGAPRGASWGPNDVIVFATTDPTTGLLSVPAGGGEPRPLSKPDRDHGELDHILPFVMPDAESVLLTVVTNANQPTLSHVDLLDLKTGQRKTLINGGTQAEYVETGHLLFISANSLRAAPFDFKNRTVTGDAIPLIEQVMALPTGAAEYDVSRQGSIVYLSGTLSTTAPPRSLVWVNRQGREEIIQGAPSRSYAVPRISPDGTRAALDIRDRNNDIWIWDFTRQTLTPLTFAPSVDMSPVWTPDNKRVIWASVAELGTPNLFWQSADGTGAPERLTTSANAQFPTAVSLDGSSLFLFQGTQGAAQMDIHVMTLPSLTNPSPSTQAPAIRTVISTKALEVGGAPSPNGRWLAYQSDKSGQFEIYVSPFPSADAGLWQVSTSGGTRPVWSRDGRELFYLDGKDLLTVVPVETNGTAFSAGNPRRLLDTAYFAGSTTRGFDLRGYDVAPDGQRFLMIKETAPQDPHVTTATVTLNVVLNWVEELKARVRPKP